MINTILVEDDLYIQKHFTEQLNADGGFRLSGVYRDAFEAEKYCTAAVDLVLMDVQTQHKHSGLAAAARMKQDFRASRSWSSPRWSIPRYYARQNGALPTACGTRITGRRSCWMS